MAERYRVFASHLLFKELVGDALGHLYRAGELGPAGIRRTAWLRVFDGPLAARADLAAVAPRARRVNDALQSASIASAVTFTVAGGVLALAHDYVPSQPLSRVLERVASEGFPIPIDNSLLIAEKLALALSAGLAAEIDGTRVVHGLLNPALVFVTYDGECVVAGFGLGDELLAAVGDAAEPSILPYLAPESLLARNPSRQGDVYSLGAILYHLLTGSPLPADPALRMEAIAAARLAGDDEALPDDIRSLLGRSLAERAQDRFSSASDFKKELDRLLYGGAYSPTTFNLALFMDRLFRTEIEGDERERALETALDVAPYLVRPVEMPEEPRIEIEETGAETSRPRGWVIGAAAAAVVAAVAAAVFLGTRGPDAPAPPPTPTADEIAAQRQAQEDAMRALTQSLVQEMMAAKEAEIRKELTDRQAKIDDLQRRLRASEQQVKVGQQSSDEERGREALRRQIAAEEEAQRQQEARLEAERQRAEETARQQAAVDRTATAVAIAASAVPAASPPPSPEAAAAGAVAAGAAVPAAATVATQPAMAAASPTAAPASPAAREEPAVSRNAFVEPTEVDSLPVAIKVVSPQWSLVAQRSRRWGVIILQATVNADGAVDDVKVLRADDTGFGIPEAAIAAARQYRFKPGTKAGVQIRTYATITVPYRFDKVR